MRKSVLLACAVLASASVASRGDEIVLENNLTYSPVDIIRVEQGVLTFRLPTRNVTGKPLGEIKQITVTGWPQFNNGEEALVAGKAPRALKAYGAAASEARRKWQKTLLDYRRLQAANAAKRPDIALEAWRKLLSTQKVSKPLLALRPGKDDLPQSGAPANRDAIALARKLLDKGAKGYADSLRQFLLMLYQREGMDQEAAKLAAELAGQATRPSNGSKTSDDGPGAAAATTQLQGAVVVVEQGNAGADALRKIASSLREGLGGNAYAPAERPTALLTLGKAQQQLVRRHNAGGQMRIRAGLNFMRVVAWYASSAQAAEALYRAGQVNEALGNASAAEAAWRKVASVYNDSPFAARAREAMKQK